MYKKGVRCPYNHNNHFKNTSNQHIRSIKHIHYSSQLHACLIQTFNSTTIVRYTSFVMKFASMFAAVGAIASVAALPANQPRQACTNPEKKVEWRQMDAGDQKAYLDAVLSLKTKPSKIGLNSTLYDDFGNVHYHLNKWSQSSLATLDSVMYKHLLTANAPVHGGPSFLPWHRYFSYVYLKTLRDECGYTGPGP